MSVCNGKNTGIRRKYKSNMNWRLQLICSIQASWEVNVELTSGTFRQTGVNDNNNNDNINNDEENDDYECNHKIAKQE